MKSKPLRIVEEVFNSVTHGVGAILSVFALIYILTHLDFKAETYKSIGMIIFGISLVLLYLGSTLLHSLKFTKAKKVFQRIDHSLIFVLIAGTYSPILLGPLIRYNGLLLFSIMWIIAIFGIVMKSVFFDRFDKVSLILYLLMGWFIVFSIKDLINMTSINFLIWMLIGGVSYSLGIIFFVWDRLPFNHVIWHFFVLSGSITQYIGIVKFVL